MIEAVYLIAVAIGVLVALIAWVPLYVSYRRRMKVMQDPLQAGGLKRRNIVYKTTEIHRDDGTLMQQWDLMTPNYDGHYRKVQILTFDERGKKIIGRETWDMEVFNTKIRERNKWGEKNKY